MELCFPFCLLENVSFVSLIKLLGIFPQLPWEALVIWVLKMFVALSLVASLRSGRVQIPLISWLSPGRELIAFSWG